MLSISVKQYYTILHIFSLVLFQTGVLHYTNIDRVEQDARSLEHGKSHATGPTTLRVSPLAGGPDYWWIMSKTILLKIYRRMNAA